MDLLIFWLCFAAYFAVGIATMPARARTMKRRNYLFDSRSDCIALALTTIPIWPLYHGLILMVDSANWLAWPERRGPSRKDRKRERLAEAERQRQKEIADIERHLKELHQQLRQAKQASMYSWDDEFRKLEGGRR